MAEDGEKPIIVKKIIKGGHGSHGGAWKIAYADFVTAMMAFFLLLWLLNSVTQESLEGISNFFSPVSVSQSTSGSGDILGGQTITEEGAAISATARDSVTVDLPPPRAGTGGDLAEGEQGPGDADPTDEDVEAAAARKEEADFQEAQEELEQTIDALPQMRALKDSLVVDNTPEGLRIQLIDRDGLAMFPSGGSNMFLHTQRLLELVSKVIQKLPQDISISGHTDAVPFRGQDYGNWELSADRANAARRQLERFDVPEDRVSRVVGKAATEPFNTEDPKHPSNRRLSIILLRGTGREAEAARDQAAQQAEPEALPGLNEIRARDTQPGDLGSAVNPPSVAPSAPSNRAPIATEGGVSLTPDVGSDGLPVLNLEIQQDITAQ